MLKKPFVKKILINFAPKIVYYLMGLILFTCKKKYVLDDEIDGRQSVYCCWHGELLLFPSFHRDYLLKFGKNIKLNVLISQHTDGEMIARFFNIFGHQSIRGSTSKGAVKSLVEAIKTVKSGCSLGLTPDGPRGPRHSVADGVAVIAQKANVGIICFNYNATSFWQFNSWDKFTIPKPFSTITFYAKYLNIEGLNVDEIKIKVKDELMKNAI